MLFGGVTAHTGRKVIASSYPAHGSQEQYVSPQAFDSHDFGGILRHLRLTYFPRIASRRSETDPTSARAARETGPLPIRSVIDYLDRRGYATTIAAYTEFETGATLPPDAAAFVRAVVECLEASESESLRLKTALAYRVLVDALGPELAEQSIYGTLG